MRLLQAKAKPDLLWKLRQNYEERVVPALQKTPGCLYACLMQSSHVPEEVISMTMWESQKHAEDYESSGLSRQLFDETRPMLADSSEWRLELSKDLKLEYVPTPVEPTVKSMPVAVMSGDLKSGFDRPTDMFLRIVSAKLKPDKKDEFRELYLHEIIPALEATKGCRHAYLLIPDRDKSEAMSITIWESKAAAEEYEAGEFSSLLDTVKHTFTGLSQWKMNLGRERGKTATSDDISVDGYFFVGGKSFRG
jgi:quinol monooxygenase YgiN